MAERPSIPEGVPVPKYYRLKESIRAMIEEEELGEGRLIPSERELCERYGYSRMTARQAVKELVDEGVLYREQGRGTFVAGEKLHHETARLTSFTQDMQERGMEASSTVLEAAVEQAGHAVASRLRAEPGKRVFRVKRVRNADGKPMALETSHLLYEVGKELFDADLETSSLYEELGKRGVRIARAEQSYEATLVKDQEAQHIGVPAGSSALLVERITFDDSGQPFEYVKSIYRGDRYRVSIMLHP